MLPVVACFEDERVVLDPRMVMVGEEQKLLNTISHSVL